MRISIKNTFDKYERSIKWLCNTVFDILTLVSHVLVCLFICFFVCLLILSLNELFIMIYQHFSTVHNLWNVFALIIIGSHSFDIHSIMHLWGTFLLKGNGALRSGFINIDLSYTSCKDLWTKISMVMQVKVINPYSSAWLRFVVSVSEAEKPCLCKACIHIYYSNFFFFPALGKSVKDYMGPNFHFL